MYGHTWFDMIENAFIHEKVQVEHINYKMKEDRLRQFYLMPTPRGIGPLMSKSRWVKVLKIRQNRPKITWKEVSKNL